MNTLAPAAHPARHAARASRGTPVVDVRDFSFAYGPRQVLRHLSFGSTAPGRFAKASWTRRSLLPAPLYFRLHLLRAIRLT